ncbi:class I SAM-dependent methyltransferase [Williamsia sp.]|uniref:class I SAM-dependent methyltransferase n=1 Tax=Williamsia sp. TaxID=1872085 RepID=UPI001A3293A7|nr:class I SAM-dependent methyltransferase [Williamsia sp.]MBJ7289141.1 class I SAM-dependent methyltransferase [Williamsia sp.]
MAALEKTLENYNRVGRRLVEGYTKPEVFPLLKHIDEVQRELGVSGGAAEIGVHHGQLFLALSLLESRAVAIDLFDDQDANIDNSGKGDLGRFRTNLRRWTDGDVTIHAGDSTALTATSIPELSDIRLFSVDGGHTAQIVRSDMTLAESVLVDGGVVIADDVFNQYWPGVCVGTLEYLRTGGLRPFAIGHNKVLFTQPEYCERYRAHLVAAYENSFWTALDESSFDGNPVTVLVRVPRKPVHALRRSSTARRAYHRVLGLLPAR